MTARLCLFSLVACLPLQVLAHGHPANIDPAAPDAWKYALCDQMTTVSSQAMRERDRGLPPRQYTEDGGPGPRIANAIVQRVYAEPGISSPKRAETFGRAFCNEQLQSTP